MSTTSLKEIKSLFKNYDRKTNLINHQNGTFLFHIDKSTVKALVFNPSYSAPCGYSNYKSEFASAQHLEKYVNDLISGKMQHFPNLWYNVQIKFSSDPLSAARLDDCPPLTRDELLNEASIPAGFDPSAFFDADGMPSTRLQRIFAKEILAP